MDSIKDLTEQIIKDKYEELWVLNPNGDKNKYFFRFSSVVKSGIDPDKIINSYRDYMISKSEYQNGKFTSKKDRVVDIYDFLVSEMYNQSFSSTYAINKERDDYVYKPV